MPERHHHGEPDQVRREAAHVLEAQRREREPARTRSGRPPASTSRSRSPWTPTVRKGQERTASRRRSSRARSGSACAAASPTSRQRGQRLRQAGHARPGGPVVGHVADLHVDRAHRCGPCPRRPWTPTRASCSPSSTTGRTPRCRPGTSTTSSQVTQLRGALYRAAVKAVADGEDGLFHEDIASQGHQALGLTPATTRTQPERRPGAAQAHRSRAARRGEPAGSTWTWSAAGGSPCPTWSRPAC